MPGWKYAASGIGGLALGALTGWIVGRDALAHHDNPQIAQLSTLQAQYATTQKALANATTALHTAQALNTTDHTTIDHLTAQVQSLTTAKNTLASQIATLQRQLKTAQTPVYSMTAVMSTMPYNTGPGPQNEFAAGHQWLLIHTMKNGQGLPDQSVDYTVTYPSDVQYIYPNTASTASTGSHGYSHVAFPDTGGSITVQWVDPAGVLHEHTLALGKGTFF